MGIYALLLPGCLSFHAGPITGEPPHDQYTELRGTRLRFVDEGQGDAVVLLHGFASSLDTWDAVRPELRAGHRVLALDLKGFGFSGRPEGDYSPEEQARLVFALMDARGIERAALAAHSYGASVALAMALMAPERVTRLALYDGWVYESQLPSFFHLSRAAGVGEALFAAFYDQRPDERLELAFYNPDHVTEQLVEAVEASLARPGTRAAALAAVRGMHYARMQRRYGEVAVPTLLLWGREDRVSRLSVGERLAAQLPDAHLIIYPHCDHFPMIEAAHASTRDLLAFLDHTSDAAAESHRAAASVHAGGNGENAPLDADTETDAPQEWRPLAPGEVAP